MVYYARLAQAAQINYPSNPNNLIINLNLMKVRGYGRLIM